MERAEADKLKAGDRVLCVTPVLGFEAGSVYTVQSISGTCVVIDNPPRCLIRFYFLEYFDLVKEPEEDAKEQPTIKADKLSIQNLKNGDRLICRSKPFFNSYLEIGKAYEVVGVDPRGCFLLLGDGWRPKSELRCFEAAMAEPAPEAPKIEEDAKTDPCIPAPWIPNRELQETFGDLSRDLLSTLEEDLKKAKAKPLTFTQKFEYLDPLYVTALEHGARLCDTTPEYELEKAISLYSLLMTEAVKGVCFCEVNLTPLVKALDAKRRS